MKLGAKLIGAFIGMAAISAAVGGVGVYGLRSTAAAIEEIGVVRLPSVEGLLVMEIGATDIDAATQILLNPATSVGDRDEAYTRLDEAWKRFDTGWKIYEPLPQTPEESVMWKEFLGAFETWKAQEKTLSTAIRDWDKSNRAGATDETAKLYEATLAAAEGLNTNADHMAKLLAKITELNIGISTAEVVKGQAAASTAQAWAIGSVTVGVLLSVAAGLLFRRAILAAVLPVVARAKAIAAGDLTGVDLTVASNDELGDLTVAVNAMSSSLRELVTELASSSREVASAATQIASSSEEIASGMKEQSSQVTQISSAVEEMSQSIVEVAKKAGEAANSAGESGRLATDGGKVVQDTIQGMNAIATAVHAGAQSVGELGKRGEQIGQVITVINDIADQTNLLALNAAIEAARAGEHGRGFAVVADEVRKLADRTTKATDEIAGSIQAIQTETGQAVERMNAGTREVETGVVKATGAGQSLEQIVAGAQSVAGMVQSIAAAAEQQSAASEEVSKSIESIAAVTKQASEGSTQAAAAATQLSTKAEQLLRLVGRFQLSEAKKAA